MYRLIFQSGPQRGRRVGIRQGPVIIGRHPEATLRLPEPEIALQHVQLEDQPGGGVHLRLLAAGAGVRVNGQAVEAADLRDGDLIEIGPHVLRFSMGSAPAAVEKTGGRRLGMMQGVTLLAVGLLLLGQVIFLITVSLWRQTSATLETAAATNAAPVAVTVAVAPQNIPPVTNVPPVTPAQVVSVPSAAPPRLVTVPTPVVTSAPTGELMQLRTEIAQLQRDVQALPPPKPTVITNLVVASITPPRPPPPPAPATNTVEMEASADELVQAQARRMFKKAMERAAQLDAEELDGELATIQNMAPDFLPAILERAHLLAKRKLNGAALEQWQNIQKLAKNPDLQARAADEIAKLKVLISTPPPALTAAPPVRAVTVPPTPASPARVASVAPTPAPPAKRPHTVRPVARLTLVEPQKLLAGEKYDEMRLLRITATPTGAAPLDPAAMEVVVTFFDRGEKSGRVTPSRAVVPGSALRADAAAAADAPLEFQASYLVPRDFRQQEARQAGELRRYFGYRVDLIYRGVLQDRIERPANLLPAE